ncbi:hypothetical protein [Curtobacterium sp. RRHDQ10]|uniref:hypothetical protein n=1 Tax=Curtobacterium phyllosphaerae TaxID=3413379 RepID=UPI003BEF75FE
MSRSAGVSGAGPAARSARASSCSCTARAPPRSTTDRAQSPARIGVRWATSRSFQDATLSGVCTNSSTSRPSKVVVSA